MKTATSRTMKRRLNLEVVSSDMEVSTEAVVPVGWVIEICSLLASAKRHQSAVSWTHGQPPPLATVGRGRLARCQPTRPRWTHEMISASSYSTEVDRFGLFLNDQ